MKVCIQIMDRTGHSQQMCETKQELKETIKKQVMPLVEKGWLLNVQTQSGQQIQVQEKRFNNIVAMASTCVTLMVRPVITAG